MDKRFLVVVHAGDASSHPSWLTSPAARNWDLVVCYGGDDPGRYAAAAEDVIRIDRRGPKWQALAQLLADTREAWQVYDHVWIPSDDLVVAGEDISRMFEIVAGLGLQLAQPSLSSDSPAAHPLALHNAAFGVRFASFVDAAAPVFSRALLERALPTLADAAADEDLGQRWPRLLDNPARECAIVDRIQVRRRAAAPPPQRRRAVEPVRLCFGGFEPSGRLRHLFDPADDGFVALLRDGYADLPGVAGATLERIVGEHQAARREVIGSAPAAAAQAPFALTVGTSIAPHDEAKQQRAVASWRALGFEVVSFNNVDEIRALHERFPEVRFVEVARDGRARAGKPLVYVDDVFAWFRASGLPYGGFVNSDIVLQPADRAGFLASLRANLDGALVFSRRVEVENFDRLEGAFYPTGFDAWFWDSRVLAAFDRRTDYLVGFPHWDYYAVLMPLLHGHRIRQFAFPVAFHQTHPMYYDVLKDGIAYGLKTFELVAPHVARIPAQSHLIPPLVDFFVRHRPPTMQGAEDLAYYYAFLHALDLWFLDIIDRNSEKIRAADGRPATADAGIPFLGTPAGAAPTAACAPLVEAPAPLLSVIVPTFNRAAILERCLAHLAAQTLDADRFEVIVVDDGSSDDTPQVLETAARTHGVVHERQANLGPAAARNRALGRARGEWLLFLNDDALLEPRALEIHLDEHARRGPRAAVLGAFPLHPGYTRTDAPVGYCMDRSDLIFDYARMVPDQPYLHPHFYTCNLSIAREFVLRHGGFDEGFVRMGAEDIELGVRLQLDGCEIFYRPDCVAQHAHRLDPAGLARMFRFRGRGGVHLFAGEPRLLPHYAAMPLERVDEFVAIDARLQPLLARLDAAIARLDGLRYLATGEPGVALDEASSGIDFRSLWMWPEAEIRRMVETLAANLERHAERAAAAGEPSLEEAAGRVYPALQFVKWYHDTLGVVSSPEIRAYLAARQPTRTFLRRAA